MREQRTLLGGWIAAIVMMATSPGVLAADEAPAPKAVKTEYVWISSEAGKPVGIERMKGVLSPKQKRYTSIEVVPDKGQKGVRVMSFHERDADGTLRKYFRKEDVRMGKGIRAFRRGVGIRIVGLNQKMKAVEIPKASELQIWDPGMLSGLALWLELASGAGEISFKVLDISQRTAVTARLAPVTSATVGDPEGKAATLSCWKIWAGGAEIATTCTDGAGTLVSVKAGRVALLLKDWTWSVPVVDPAEADALGDAGATEAGGDTTEEPGVGP